MTDKTSAWPAEAERRHSVAMLRHDTNDARWYRPDIGGWCSERRAAKASDPIDAGCRTVDAEELVKIQRAEIERLRAVLGNVRMRCMVKRDLACESEGRLDPYPWATLVNLIDESLEMKA